MEIEGTNDNSTVKVYLSGNQEPLRVEISADAYNLGAEALSGQVTAADERCLREVHRNPCDRAWKNSPWTRLSM
jgi:DNA-binding protein YbaB